MTHQEKLSALAKEIQMTCDRYMEEFDLPLASVAGALVMVQQIMVDMAIRDFEVDQAVEDEDDEQDNEGWKDIGA